MTIEERKRHLPPYVSYTTFKNFLIRLQQQIPTRIDRSYWGETLSGSTGTQLMAAMRFLNLVDVNARPTPRLKLLVEATGEHRAVLLRQIANESYSFALKGSFDSQNASYAELEDIFHHTFNMKSDVNRKCIKFFTELSKDAGIPLSPAIIKKRKIPRNSFGTKNTIKKSGTGTIRNFDVPAISSNILELDPWHKSLLEKFPAFDPAWNDEIKLNWFTALGQLIRLNPNSK
jgi:hypothetical protein